MLNTLAQLRAVLRCLISPVRTRVQYEVPFGPSLFVRVRIVSVAIVAVSACGNSPPPHAESPPACSCACITQPSPSTESQCSVHPGAAKPPTQPLPDTDFTVRAEGAQLQSGAVLELATVTCEAEPTLRSTSGDSPVLVRFLNLRAEPVELIWLDYDGKRKSYGTLAAGAAREQQTYLTHPWMIANASGACIDIRMPRATGYQTTIR
ncbi:MAG: hypothetical protein ABUL62_22020 [Myxococcales bacterium]